MLQRQCRKCLKNLKSQSDHHWGLKSCILRVKQRKFPQIPFSPCRISALVRFWEKRKWNNPFFPSFNFYVSAVVSATQDFSQEVDAARSALSHPAHTSSSWFSLSFKLWTHEDKSLPVNCWDLCECLLKSHSVLALRVSLKPFSIENSQGDSASERMGDMAS